MQNVAVTRDPPNMGPTLLGPSEGANHNHWTRDPTPSPYLRTETDPVSETLCVCLFFNYLELPGLQNSD
jgi:hypothetical protein